MWLLVFYIQTLFGLYDLLLLFMFMSFWNIASKTSNKILKFEWDKKDISYRRSLPLPQDFFLDCSLN